MVENENKLGSPENKKTALRLRLLTWGLLSKAEGKPSPFSKAIIEEIERPTPKLEPEADQ